VTGFSTAVGNRRSIPSIFAPHAAKSKASAAPETLPLAVKTSPERWTYAKKFLRAETAPDHGAVIVIVEIEVSVGVVGVGCLNLQKTDFLDEAFVSAAPGPQSVELVVADAGAVNSLIVRNASPDGSSEARMLGIACFAFDAPADARRHPPLAEPAPTPNWARYYGTRGATPLEKLRVQAFNALQQPTVLRWTDGTGVRIIPGDQLSRTLYVSGSYEPNTLCVLRQLLRPGDVCVDVGANAGLVTLAASQWVGPAGHVYSIEPSQREFARLRDNLALNAVSNATPLHAALSDHAGQVSLRVADSSHGGLNTLGNRFAYDNVDVAAVEIIEALTLDDFVDRYRIERISVIKLDVEGAEGAVLLGSRRVLQELRPALIVEVFARALAANEWTVADLDRLLRDARYRLFTIDDATAMLTPVAQLVDLGECNVVAVPEERGSAGVPSLSAR
jgi:FkbM family methyltransferase